MHTITQKFGVTISLPFPVKNRAQKMGLSMASGKLSNGLQLKGQIWHMCFKPKGLPVTESTHTGNKATLNSYVQPPRSLHWTLMDAAQTIREAVSRVEKLRVDASSNLALQAATVAVKSLQARRFAGTYADLLSTNEYGKATRFFLDDLYSDKDYSLRDAQFAKIAGGLQRLFPQQVIATAVSLAKLHILTEELDRQMAEAWMTVGTIDAGADDAALYVACWTAVNRESDRNLQLKMVLEIGDELDRLTRIAGLRLLLRMMRGPAMAARIGSLQAFLESGFDIFAHMSGKGSGAQAFLSTIRERESSWIKRLSSTNRSEAAVALGACLENAR
jgi:hypothetical protein